ncbi:MAG: cell surface protein SprA, partial [Gemmatimonadales bacterium]
TGLPANNFGVQATVQLGALEARGILATQSGNVIRDRIFTVGALASQPLDREVRDLEFELGRFFFAVDPARLPGFPGVDILNLDPSAFPADVRVGQLRVYRLRALSTRTNTNQNLGGIKAIALSVDSAQRVGPFPWELLVEGRDYYSDASGAWIGLANRLDDNDFLAVSYVTADGLDSVGSFPATAREDTVTEFLQLVYEPRPAVGVQAATFRFEMRNAYRVGSSDLVRESAELRLTVNERERSQASDQPYLALLGLAQQNDPSRFDEYNRLFPRQRDPNGGAPIRDYFVIFPHLTPFADSVRLTPQERNDSLYRTPRDLLRTQGPASLFALGMHYEASGAGDRTRLSLGAFQIREGSERLFIGQRELVRGADYTMAYDVGQVTFTDPDALFAGPTQVRVQFEERAGFDVAPTTVVGLATRYDLGTYGSIHTLGLFQRQQSAFTRPPLGLEPSSSFVGTVIADLRFRPEGLTRFLDRLPLIETETPSSLSLTAEAAVSKPNPNQAGQAYLEEFEGDQGIRLPLGENLWQLGSVPSSAHGLAPYGLLAFDTLGTAALTWQNLIVNASGLLVEFTPEQIDTSIVLAGATRAPEQILWVSLKQDTIGGLANRRTGLSNWRVPHQPGVRWRSISQSLGSTGLDLTRTEFLEFWVWEDGARTARNNG